MAKTYSSQRKYRSMFLSLSKTSSTANESAKKRKMEKLGYEKMTNLGRFETNVTRLLILLVLFQSVP